MSDAASSNPSRMASATPVQSPAPHTQLPPPVLRLWPVVSLLLVQWSAVLIVNWAMPGTMPQFMTMLVGPMIGGVLFSGWWLFGSRVPVRDRWVLWISCLALAGVTYFVAHPSIGKMGISLYGLPAITTAWTAWLVIASRWSWTVRRAVLFLLIIGIWGYLTLLRLEGINGSLVAQLSWRWDLTAEEKFLAESRPSAGSQSPATSTAPSKSKPSETIIAEPEDWLEFRGPNRDSRRTNTHLDTNWTAHPPKQIWRHRIGPGWSSFAVVAQRLYTQEQRGEEEVTVCYEADTGKEIWAHGDKTRFSEVVAGPGPRGTPTFHAGQIFALGATGKLNCLDAQTGRVIWTKDIVSESSAKTPTWGFSSSPLVVEDLVTVYAGGPENKGILAYRTSNGDLAWSAPSGQFSYCSLQRSRLAGVEQLLIATNLGLTAYEPVTGKQLWQHDWPLEAEMSRVVQPAVINETDVLVGTSFGYGTRRVQVTDEGAGWKTREIWTSRAIKPYYNDLVVRGDDLYGFDGNIFTCVSLKDGKNKWRARGYGNGQVLLLADQKLLLILSETGEVALVDATPDGHKELTRFQAIEGKTWNHPVLVRNRLYVRNGEETACYEVPQLKTQNTALQQNANSSR